MSETVWRNSIVSYVIYYFWLHYYFTLILTLMDCSPRTLLSVLTHSITWTWSCQKHLILHYPRHLTLPQSLSLFWKSLHILEAIGKRALSPCAVLPLIQGILKWLHASVAFKWKSAGMVLLIYILCGNVCLFHFLHEWCTVNMNEFFWSYLQLQLFVNNCIMIPFSKRFFKPVVSITKSNSL